MDSIEWSTIIVGALAVGAFLFLVFKRGGG